ncbi:MAG: response regulator [Bacteroidales bacterium]
MEKKIRILFAEDLPADLELAQREIKKENIAYEYVVVDDEAGFREKLTEFNPDIIISDYSMPTFDGMKALTITRSYSTTLPFIILTGSMNEETAVECMKAGANDYVIKEHINRLPFSIIEAIENSHIRREMEKIERELRESEDKFRSLFENHAAIKLIIEPETGNIAQANKAAAKFYEYPVAELEKMNIADVNTSPVSEITKAIELAINKKEIHFDFVHKKADGSLCDVETFSSVVTIRGKDFLHSIIHDVTEKKKVEKQLQLLSRSVDQSPVSIIITDSKGEIEYVNPTFSKISGYQYREVLGKSPAILKSEFQSKEFYKELWDTILAGKDWSGELKNRKKNGEYFWENVIISPILDEQGNITHFVGVKEDITNTKKMISELIRAKEKAEESDRLKSAFLANMSHEIRTPMNGIMGFLELLQRPDIPDDKKEIYTDVVRKSSVRMLNTINDLIEISKIEANQVELQLSRIDVNDMLDYFLKFFKPEADKREINFSIKEKLPDNYRILYTDKNKLESIVSNLIKNALKFTKSGFINIGCTVSESEQLNFYVEDSGIGIAVDKQEKIFNRFVQAEVGITRSHEGSGLGLAISKAYAELLDGTIGVESTPGEGSKFHVSIPFRTADEPVTEKKKSIASEHQFNAGPYNNVILVAEDDLDSYAFLEVVLMEYNFRVIHAKNGAEAVMLFSQHPEINMVLMDIKMPLMDGIEATRKIREMNKVTPVIAQSAYALTGDDEKAQEAGCNDYIAKPIAPAELLEKMSRWL